MPRLLSRREELDAIRLARSQPGSHRELKEVASRLTKQVTAVALRDSRVRDRLADARHRVLGVDYRDEKTDGGRLVRLADVGIYDYDSDVLVVATVDHRTGRVVDLVERQGASPPITNDERREAREIVASDARAGAAFRRRGARVVAFPTPSYAFDAERRRHGHRGCTLYTRAGRGSVVAVTVDLTAREVVADEKLPEVLRSPADRPASRGKEG